MQDYMLFTFKIKCFKEVFIQSKDCSGPDNSCFLAVMDVEELPQPPFLKIPHTVSFCCKFFKGHYEIVTKSGKSQNEFI